jgi:large subunit ribosomal protein L23
MSKTLILKPRVSEKAYGQSIAKNTYGFVVPTDANKQSVAAAVEAQFGVTVTAVNILNVVGKAKRTVRKGGKQVSGKDANFKKAYVTLKEGDNIAVFKTEDDKSEPKGKKETK